jgi:hypothetical protein
MPGLAGFLRDQALPTDILDVIRIAAGCPHASDAAILATQESLETVRAASVLYLQEMLFFPDAGIYRNLGVAADASKAQMRLHMRWLLQWLHPDHNPDETAGLLAQRVILAWRQLGHREGSFASPAGQSLSGLSPRNGPRRPTRMRLPWIPVPVQSAPPRRVLKFRMAVLVLAFAAAIVSILFPNAFVGKHSLPRIARPASQAIDDASTPPIVRRNSD